MQVCRTCLSVILQSEIHSFGCDGIPYLGLHSCHTELRLQVLWLVALVAYEIDFLVGQLPMDEGERLAGIHIAVGLDVHLLQYALQVCACGVYLSFAPLPLAPHLVGQHLYVPVTFGPVLHAG